MGEEHHSGGSTWVPALLVVVSVCWSVNCLCWCGVGVWCVCVCVCFPHSVFWDLYCAAPERRDSCEHSSEAKAFHDYVSMDTFCLPQQHCTWLLFTVPLWGWASYIISKWVLVNTRQLTPPGCQILASLRLCYIHRSEPPTTTTHTRTDTLRLIYTSV